MAGLLLALGLLLVLSGGFALVHGASHLAQRLGVPTFIVGLTVVAFGTSAPELAVNLFAALRGDAEISFGNVIGSNLANIGLILGVAALVTPLTIDSLILQREIPMMLLATAAVIVMALDPGLRGLPAAYDRLDGLLLLLFFSVFLYTAATTVLRRREADELIKHSAEIVVKPLSMPRSCALIVVGGFALAGGGQITVQNAVLIAAGFGVPPAIIGLSAVAVGTSLPELAASAIAAVRGEADIAVANVVGSNIFNLLFIFGLTAGISPVPLPPGGVADLVALTVLSLVLLGLAATARRVTRVEGGLLLLAWAAYTGWRLAPLAGGLAGGG